MRRAHSLAALMVLLVVLSPFSAMGTLEDGKILELTPPGDGRSDTTPETVLFNGDIYVLWLTAQSDGGDNDIVWDKYSEGHWSGMNYLTRSEGNERDIALCSTPTRLFAAWVSDSTDYTTGDDWDVALSYNSGSGWSQPIEVSPTGDEENDYHPALAYDGGMLYIFWMRDNEKGSDIMLRTWDGSRLSEIITITSGWGGDNIAPTASVLGGHVYVAWASNSTTYTDGMDMDIVAMDYNAGSSSIRLVSPAGDVSDDAAPDMTACGDSLYLVWSTSDKTITVGDDDDIVISVLSGDMWSYPMEVTSPHDTGSDTFPRLLCTTEGLYIFWETNDPSTSSGSDWDIVYTIYGSTGYHEVTPLKDGADDGNSYTAGYSAAALGNGIFLCWETDNPDITDGIDRDIVYILDGGSSEKEDGSGGDKEKNGEDTESTSGDDANSSGSVGDVGNANSGEDTVLLGVTVVLALTAVALIGVYMRIKKKE